MRTLANLGEGERRGVIAAAARTTRQRKSHVASRSIHSATMAEIVLDAHVIVALLYADDSQHQQVRRGRRASVPFTATRMSQHESPAGERGLVDQL